MKSDIELVNRIEAYFRGELSSEERVAFEKLRNENSGIDQQVVNHHNLMKQIADYGDYKQLKTDMEHLHSELDIDALKSEVLPESSRILILWRRYKGDVTVAASVAILAAFLTMLSTGYITKSTTDPNYNYLNRKVDILARSQKQINQKLNSNIPTNPGEFAATGFALSTNGFVITNYHVVKSADSVYIENADGESFKARIVHTDPFSDIAILQITDPDFTPFNSLPYIIKKSSSDVGEDVFTVGYPRDISVYTKGYISAQNGYKDEMSDTTTYQVALLLNAGNSGAPVLDSKGNVIGIISAKQKQVEAATFAVKSKYMLKAIEIAQDSLEQNLVLNKKNSLAGLSRTDQLKKMQKYIFVIKAY